MLPNMVENTASGIIKNIFIKLKNKKNTIKIFAYGKKKRTRY